MNTRNITAQHGTTLIETLIALFVMAIGLLGIAALHAKELRTTHEAFHHTAATVAAKDIVERMRANLGGFAAGAYTYTPNAALPAVPACTGDCSATQTAARDINEWITQLQTNLPKGTAELSCTDAKGDTTAIELGSLCNVTVMWDERRLNASLETVVATKTACGNGDDELNCVSLIFSP